MPSKWLVTFTKEGMKLSRYARSEIREYLRKNPHTIFELSPRDTPSRSARGYFEGAVVPTFAQWSDHYDHHNPDDLVAVRELLKREFNGKWVTGFDGSPQKIAMSTTSLNRKEFRESFIEAICVWFDENGIPRPDPELYKEWRDKYSINYPHLTYIEWLEQEGLNPDGTRRESSHSGSQ